MASNSGELHSNSDDKENDRDSVTIVISPPSLLSHPSSSSFPMTPPATPSDPPATHTEEANPANSEEKPVESQPHPTQLLTVPGLYGSSPTSPAPLHQTKEVDVSRSPSVLTTASQLSNVSLRGAIVLSCLTTLFCGILFGAIGFSVASKLNFVYSGVLASGSELQTSF